MALCTWHHTRRGSARQANLVAWCPKELIPGSHLTHVEQGRASGEVRYGRIRGETAHALWHSAPERAIRGYSSMLSQVMGRREVWR